MARKWLLALVLVCLGSLPSAGRAVAQAAYTTDSLAALLVTSSEFNAASGAAGSDQLSDDTPATFPYPGAVVRVDRLYFLFGSTSGSSLVIQLFVNADGSAPSAAQQDAVLNGDLIRNEAQVEFDSIGDVTVGDAAGIGDADQTAVITGTSRGRPYSAVADSFIKGNIYGVVMHLARENADPELVGAVAQAQVMKLP